jgi:predicted nucleic acid-binding protein
LSLTDALQIATRVEGDMEERTYDVSTEAVLRLVDETGHSAYDGEYVALARQLGVALVTGDQQVVDRFPDTAVLLEDAAG